MSRNRPAGKPALRRNADILVGRWRGFPASRRWQRWEAACLGEQSPAGTAAPLHHRTVEPRRTRGARAASSAERVAGVHLDTVLSSGAGALVGQSSRQAPPPVELRARAPARLKTARGGCPTIKNHVEMHPCGGDERGLALGTERKQEFNDLIAGVRVEVPVSLSVRR